MTLILDLDLDILNLRTKTKSVVQSIQKLKHEQDGHTDTRRQTRVVTTPCFRRFASTQAINNMHCTRSTARLWRK